MSDHMQSSSISLAKQSKGSSSHAGNPFSLFDSAGSVERSFSSELSRATDQASPSQARQSAPEKRDVGAKDEQSDRHTNNPRSSDNAQRSDSGTSAADGAHNKPRQSRHDDTAQVDNNRQTKQGPSNSHENAHADQSDESARQLASADSQAGNTAALQHLDTTSITAEDAPESVLASAADMSVEPDETIETEVINALAFSESADAASGGGTEINNAPESGAPSIVLPHDSSPDSEIADSGVNAQQTLLQPILAGEQLSPGELAHRQAHLVGNTGLHEPPATVKASTTLAGVQQQADINIDSASVRLAGGGNVAAVTSGALLSAQLGDDVSAKDASTMAASQSAALPQLAGEQLAQKQLKEADLQANADVNTRLVAQRLEQQSLQAGLANERQQAQQQMQNPNPVAQALGADTSTSNASTDNMFLSLPSGIVTAPVNPRADVAGTSTINAPITMPLLQSDADKAMAGNIRWMVNEGVKNAVVNVMPQGMGPISVSIGIEKDQMNVSIVALQGSTREALDSMLPRLREQLASQGHDSVKVDISDGRPEQSDRGYGQHSDAQQQSQQAAHSSSASVAGNEPESADEPVELVSTSAIEGEIRIDSNGQIRRSYDVYV